MQYCKNLEILVQKRSTALFLIIPDNPLRTASFTCHINQYDKDQYCRCPKGKRISKFRSVHDNVKEDRKWDLGCDDIQKGSNAFDNLPIHDTYWKNDYDGVSWWGGRHTNSFLVGMKSKHSNHYEDRRYNYFYQNSPNLKLTQCSNWKQLNHIFKWV